MKTEQKDLTTIKIDKDTRKELMLFKIQSEAKNLDEVIKKAIILLKQKRKEDGTKYFN